MANLLSDGVSVKLDNASGTLTDISSYLNSCELGGGNALLEITGLGDARRSEQRDIKPIQTISMNGFFNSTTEPIIAPLSEGTSVLKTVEIQQITGQYLSGEAVVGEVSISLPIGLQTFSLELRASDSTGFVRTSVAQA